MDLRVVDVVCFSCSTLTPLSTLRKQQKSEFIAASSGERLRYLYGHLISVTCDRKLRASDEPSKAPSSHVSVKTQVSLSKSSNTPSPYPFTDARKFCNNAGAVPRWSMGRESEVRVCVCTMTAINMLLKFQVRNIRCTFLPLTRYIPLA